MDELEVASAYLISIVSSPGDLPKMEGNLQSVAPGAAVSLQDEYGNIRTIVIDPIETEPLPSKDGFYSADSPEAKALFGLEVGSKIDFSSAFSTKRNFEVKEIFSAYRRLLHIAQEKLDSSLSGVEAVASISVPRTEDGVDFSNIHAVLRQRAEHFKQVLKSYADGPITLGILAKLLGRNIVDVVFGWRADIHSLFVSAGTTDLQEKARELLKRNDAIYVVDAATIAELVWLGCHKSLSVLPKLLCSTETLETLEMSLREAEDRKGGLQCFDDEGAMKVIQVSEEAKTQHIDYCRDLVEAVRVYCEIVPAYGPNEIRNELGMAEGVLADEEYSALLLVAEYGATLLTVDGRLAQLCIAATGQDSIWPQSLLERAFLIRQMSQRTYSLAVIKEFLGGRSFVSLSSHDLLFMCWQGTEALRLGLHRLKDYISNPSTDLLSVQLVAFHFLRTLVALSIQIKAFLELFSHIIEAIFQHPQCNAFMIFEMKHFAREMAEATASPEVPLRQQQLIRQHRIDALYGLMIQQIEKYQDNHLSEERNRPIRLKIVMCSKLPQLIFDGDV
jgi:hypothetical protein